MAELNTAPLRWAASALIMRDDWRNSAVAVTTYTTSVTAVMAMVSLAVRLRLILLMGILLSAIVLSRQ